MNLITSAVFLLQKMKSRKAAAEDLTTCHGEAYGHVYGSSSHKWDPIVIGMYAYATGNSP